MKVAFISDIHGNADALAAVLEDIRNKRADAVKILGDLCFRGPEPKQALDLIRQSDAQVIKGNADAWVVRGIRRGEVPDEALETMCQERDWTYAQLSEKDIKYLQTLPEEIQGTLAGTVPFHAFHATPSSLFKNIQANAGPEAIQENLLVKDAALYLYGHIHTAYIKYINGKCVVNLGSVGLPFDGLDQASYAMVTVENGRYSVSIERVPYDTEKVIQKYQQSGYPNAQALITIIKNAQI
ncbi:serine/threonine protein phosphatase [Pullulanibacillus camelliae]|uniref:Serine/threonine protein phosphatase n=1 Tax=Pullulanibacillus camelliae TaxID=1707096 RepID=A0A8J2VN19_9BACL|nr:metallophosphoesterase family protein [Pullulanibacillus camelliae]GGE33761.1 serine/threonine protein phosphatase [Pullulanibacillus camelliae]